MVRKVLTASGALLAGFHVWVFSTQLWDGSLADAGLLLRWGVAAALAASLWYLRRQNVSLIWGRKAVAIWLLAAVLHGPSIGDRLTALDTMATAEAGAALMQVAAGTGLLTLLVLAFFTSRRDRGVPWPCLPGVPTATSLIVYSVSSTPFAPRPPPAR